MIELLLEAERALEMGRTDAAERLYRQVENADPRNVIAVVGLARVTLERGDEQGALATARRALAIDPDNSPARRMVTRLEEVLRYRGEPVPEPTPAEPASKEPASEEPAAPPAEATDARRSILGRIIRR